MTASSEIKTIETCDHSLLNLLELARRSMANGSTITKINPLHENSAYVRKTSDPGTRDWHRNFDEYKINDVVIVVYHPDIKPGDIENYMSSI